jgi:hypothetical protein
MQHFAEIRALPRSGSETPLDCIPNVAHCGRCYATIWLRRNPSMSMEAHLAELERRHRALEAEIVEARAHRSIDDLQIVELKRRKLLVKDEIARQQS